MVSKFEFFSYGFVSDFDIRISDLVAASPHSVPPWFQVLLSGSTFLVTFSRKEARTCSAHFAKCAELPASAFQTGQVRAPSGARVPCLPGLPAILNTAKARV